MEIILYNQLSTRSRRALLRTKKQYGHRYEYNPRGDLLRRLAQENGMTLEEVYDQLMRERKILIADRTP